MYLCELMISIKEAILKAMKYCAYQERCHSELKSKLYELGLYKRDVEEVVSTMISEGFLNEERFAIAFAGGKFRIKKWGKIKIISELKKRKVSDYCIQKGISEIRSEEYRACLNALIKKKIGFKKKLTLLEKSSVSRYAIGRGFERELVWELLGKQID